MKQLDMPLDLKKTKHNTFKLNLVGCFSFLGLLYVEIYIALLIFTPARLCLTAEHYHKPFT